MFEIKLIAPVLRSLRVISFSSSNPIEGSVPVTIKVGQEIDIALAIPSVTEGPLAIEIKIAITATATPETKKDFAGEFAGKYLVRFVFDAGITEEMVSGLMEMREYQYMLSAQAFPIAMSHFQRELLATGINPRPIPLGLRWHDDVD